MSTWILKNVSKIYFFFKILYTYKKRVKAIFNDSHKRVIKFTTKLNVRVTNKMFFPKCCFGWKQMRYKIALSMHTNAKIMWINHLPNKQFKMFRAINYFIKNMEISALYTVENNNRKWNERKISTEWHKLWNILCGIGTRFKMLLSREPFHKQ